jgi:hypothetical protein
VQAGAQAALQPAPHMRMCFALLIISSAHLQSTRYLGGVPASCLADFITIDTAGLCHTPFYDVTCAVWCAAAAGAAVQ